MRRCGKQCYVVDIYWPGLLRASETLSITKMLLFDVTFKGCGDWTIDRAAGNGCAERRMIRPRTKESVGRVEPWVS